MSSEHSTSNSADHAVIDMENDPNFDAVVDLLQAHDTAAPQSRPFLGIDHQPQRQRITYDEGMHIGVQNQVDFVVLPLTRYSALEKTVAPLMERVSGGENPLLRQTDMLLRTSAWSNKVVGAIDERSIEGLIASDAKVRETAERVIREEIEWASHLSLPSVMVPVPADLKMGSRVVAPLARILNQIVNTRMHFSAIWVQLPLVLEEGGYAEMYEKFFKLWLKFKTLCNYHTHIGVVLRLQKVSKELQRNEKDLARLADQIFEQWFCEPLKGFIIPFSVFKKNRLGHPIIASDLHGRLLVKCFKRDHTNNVQLILQNDLPQTSFDEKDPENPISRYAPYRDYITYVYNESIFNNEDALYEDNDGDSDANGDGYSYPEHGVTEFEKPYFDYLQMPLQPLMDNLESQTYEVFERDPVKYALYEQATRRALDDIIAKYHDPQVEDNAAGNSVITLMVVGAGRGPLVKAAMRAIKKSTLSSSNRTNPAGRPPLKIMIYALEKNPNALVILHHLKNTIWMSEDDFFRQNYPDVLDVQIISGDMRKGGLGDVRCDVMISELLGSFGDNELSPECLDGARQLLKSAKAFGDDRDGVSIPYRYTSYVAPLSSNKLFMEVRTFNSSSTFGDYDHPHLESVKPFETAYVVKVHRGAELAPPQSAFTFTHTPFASAEEHKEFENDKQRNDRFVDLEFVSNLTAELHAVVGYFECVLYQSPLDPDDAVLMSILPSTHSTFRGSRMVSWFPIIFPIGKTPMIVQESEKISLQMWRQSDSNKIWYEWCVASPQATNISNVNGRSYAILK